MDDTFHLSFVPTSVPVPTVGGMKRKYLPGHQSSTRLKGMKKTVIAIPQTDANLCCASSPCHPPGPMCKNTPSGDPSSEG